MSDIEKTNTSEPLENISVNKNTVNKKAVTKKTVKKTNNKNTAPKTKVAKTKVAKTKVTKSKSKSKKIDDSKDKIKPKNTTNKTNTNKSNTNKNNANKTNTNKNTNENTNNKANNDSDEESSEEGNVKTGNVNKKNGMKGKEFVDTPRDISFFFPKTKNMNKLKMIERQIVTKPDDAENITKIIKEYVKTPGTKVITDATAGLGGTTINFANNFKSVNSVEIDKDVFEALKNNVGVYGLKNVELINKDYLTVCKDLKQDVIFIDAPWSSTGGKKKHKLMRIQLGEKFLAEVLNELKDKAEYFVFTVPGNFDYGFFMRNIQYEHVDVRMVPNRTWKVIVVYA
jgi:tRNA/tmRNA/rRNA uracil-C5-methylase (TrmA/RlmC/RlmD family)